MGSTRDRVDILGEMVFNREDLWPQTGWRVFSQYIPSEESEATVHAESPTFGQINVEQLSQLFLGPTLKPGN